MPPSGFSTTIPKRLRGLSPSDIPRAQDNWKVSRRLTLDYGVRFTWWTPFTNWDNRMATFVPSLYDPAKRVKLIYPAVVNGTKVGINQVTGQT